MTTSAACGRPVQQAGFTLTCFDVPTRSTLTNPSSSSRWTWWVQVGWLIPTASARSPMRRCPAGAVETAWRSRTRVGSDRVANHRA